ncbi:hypothetical protein AAFN60_04190 [Roseibacillus persicicus]|uniref:hypothetical protein n=1 Tax=Roseibacillus persicicus TaxID=454148 RepID=UPI00398B3441
MLAVGTIINVSILWFLITLYTRSTNSAESLRETWIVVIGMAIVRLLSHLILGGILGPFTFFIELVALYFLTEKICETSRKVSLKICLWYFLISVFLGLVFRLFAS